MSRYNTAIDHYINIASGSLILVTYASVVPSIFSGDDGGDTINQILGWSSCGLVFFGFLGWMLYASRVSRSWKLTKKIAITEKNWYSFRFSTPDFLNADFAAAPAALNTQPHSATA